MWINVTNGLVNGNQLQRQKADPLMIFDDEERIIVHYNERLIDSSNNELKKEKDNYTVLDSDYATVVADIDTQLALENV